MEIETLSLYTPAPWRLEMKMEKDRACYFFNSEAPETALQAEANRRLMQKAPELLTEIKRLIAEPRLLESEDHLRNLKELIGETEPKGTV